MMFRHIFWWLTPLCAGLLLFLWYSHNVNDRYEQLRKQFAVQKFELSQLKRRLIAARLQMDELRNSEGRCQRENALVQSKLKTCEHNAQKQRQTFGIISQQRVADAEAGLNAANLLEDIAAAASNNNQQQLEPHPVMMAPPTAGSMVEANGRKTNSHSLYPQLAPNGNFIPSRLWVHLDLKGAPLRPSYFVALLPFLKQIGINGLLIEWEDMFPYTGQLAPAVNRNAYSSKEVEEMLLAAIDAGMELVPLVQTFGHLEWVLKLREFEHLREDARYPQAICFGAEEAWTLIGEMISQVGRMHNRFGLRWFHIGADEVFQMGACNASLAVIEQQAGGSKENAILWHIARTAAFVRKEFPSTTVLAWHDMFAKMPEAALNAYNLTEMLEPVLWAYPENLDAYSPFVKWVTSLKPFKKIWGASAFKGADGPMRYSTNPMHYVRNHESWTVQMTRHYKEYDQFQGLIMTGWSRYDHFAILCELLPVALPTLAMSAETILTAQPLNGHYTQTVKWLRCEPALQLGETIAGCEFPGKRIYELINKFFAHTQQQRTYLDTNSEFNGWLSPVAEYYHFSSPMYLESILPIIDNHLQTMEGIERELRVELNRHFYADVANEFILTYMSPHYDILSRRKRALQAILFHQQRNMAFPARPFIRPHSLLINTRQNHSTVMTAANDDEDGLID